MHANGRGESDFTIHKAVGRFAARVPRRRARSGSRPMDFRSPRPCGFPRRCLSGGWGREAGRTDHSNLSLNTAAQRRCLTSTPDGRSCSCSWLSTSREAIGSRHEGQSASPPIHATRDTVTVSRLPSQSTARDQGHERCPPGASVSSDRFGCLLPRRPGSETAEFRQDEASAHGLRLHQEQTPGDRFGASGSCASTYSKDESGRAGDLRAFATLRARRSVQHAELGGGCAMRARDRDWAQVANASFAIGLGRRAWQDGLP